MAENCLKLLPCTRKWPTNFTGRPDRGGCGCGCGSGYYLLWPRKCQGKLLKTGHWKAAGRILGKIMTKNATKNLEIMYPPFDPQGPGDQRGGYMISRCLVAFLVMNFPRIRPVAFQWPDLHNSEPQSMQPSVDHVPVLTWLYWVRIGFHRFGQVLTHSCRFHQRIRLKQQLLNMFDPRI